MQVSVCLFDFTFLLCHFFGSYEVYNINMSTNMSCGLYANGGNMSPIHNSWSSHSQQGRRSVLGRLQSIHGETNLYSSELYLIIPSLNHHLLIPRRSRRVETKWVIPNDGVVTSLNYPKSAPVQRASRLVRLMIPAVCIFHLPSSVSF